MGEAKFCTDDLEKAVTRLSTMAYFPNEARAAIMLELAKMVPHKRALDWLINECVSHVSKWPGLSEVRGVLCTRFDPADGINCWCTMAGYTAHDGEMQYLEDHQPEKIGDGEAKQLIKSLKGSCSVN